MSSAQLPVPLDHLGTQLLHQARGTGTRVPDDDDPALAWQWLSSPAVDGPPDVSRYLLALWRTRVDLQEAYPGLLLDPDQRAGFADWAQAFLAEETGAPLCVISPPHRARDGEIADEAIPADALQRRLQRGVTVVGHFRSVLGIGEAARRAAVLLERCGEQVHRRSYDHTSSPATVPFSVDDFWGVSSPQLDVALLCVNGAQTARLVRALGPSALEGRYRIGLWFWELDRFPDEQLEGLRHLDEVWVASEFVADALRSSAPGANVHVIPLGTTIRDVPAGTDAWATLGLPRTATGQKTVGFAFDYASRIDRKGPLFLIDAYCRAVPRFGPGARLVIKTVNAALFPNDAAAVRRAARDRPDIAVVDANLTDEEQAHFMSSLSAYVSLHRSEGYGLGMLEAMARGVPVVATGYSGNMAFMTAVNSWLVDHRLVPVRSVEGHYGIAGARWAEPDVTDASTLLQTVLADDANVKERTERAQHDTLALVDGFVGCDAISARLTALRGRPL